MSETIYLVEMTTRVEISAPDKETALRRAETEWVEGGNLTPDDVAVVDSWDDDHVDEPSGCD